MDSIWILYGKEYIYIQAEDMRGKKMVVEMRFK